jgi:cellobiose PTS system EIIB component
MKTIILLCSAGMSTSLLVSRMQKIVAEQGLTYKVEAMATNKADEAAGIADVILLGPQVRFELNKLKERLSVPVDAIDMRDYGTMNGLNVLNQARKILGDL